MSSADQDDIQGTPIHQGYRDAKRMVDILDQVLVGLMEDPKARKADLVSMARSCKDFEDPSLNRLWASMNSIAPLLKLIHGVEEFQGSLIIAGKIDLNKLPPRFHRYANRIRDLNYEVTGDFSHITSSTWMRLARLNSPLLPNLRSLGLSYVNPSVLGRERSLLLPALIRAESFTSFTFKTSPVIDDTQEYEVGRILALLGDYDVRVEVFVASGTFISRYANVLATMNTLKSVSLELALDSTLPNMLAALSSLPYLSKLRLEFLGATPDPGQLGSHLFHKLAEVVLKGTVTFILRVLASMKAPILECVDVQVMSGSGDATQELVFPSLQLHRFLTLKRIRIDLVGCSLSPRRGERKNILSFVAPMLGAYNVEELAVVSLEPSMCLSDAEILELMKAWPLLKVLRLEHTSLPAMQPSFASLDEFAMNCPCLEELSISLREEYQHHGPSAKLRRAPAMRELDLQHTQIKRYANAGRYIDALFPFLRRFTVAEPQACTNVRDVIFEACQVARKDERDRVAMEYAEIIFESESEDSSEPGSPPRNRKAVPLPSASGAAKKKKRIVRW